MRPSLSLLSWRSTKFLSYLVYCLPRHSHLKYHHLFLPPFLGWRCSRKAFLQLAHGPPEESRWPVSRLTSREATDRLWAAEFPWDCGLPPATDLIFVLLPVLLLCLPCLCNSPGTPRRRASGWALHLTPKSAQYIQCSQPAPALLPSYQQLPQQACHTTQQKGWRDARKLGQAGTATSRSTPWWL